MQKLNISQFRTTIFFYLLFCIMSNNLHAQESKTIDSLREKITLTDDPDELMFAYYDLAKMFVLSNFDSAGIYYEKALSLAISQNNKTLTTEIYINISKLQTKITEYEKAEINCEKAILLANEIQDDELIVIANLLSAKIKITTNNYAEVLPVLEPTVEKALELNDSLLIAECYDTYGTYYFYSDVVQSIDYYLKSARILEQSEESDRLLLQMVNIGSLYGRIGQNEKSIEYLLKGVAIAKKSNIEYVLSTVYNNLAVIYFEMGDNQQSKHYLEEALTIAQKLNDEAMVCGIVVNLGELYQGEKDYETAMDYYQQGLDNPAMKNLPDQKIYTLHNIATLHFDLGEYNAAIQDAEEALDMANNLNITFHNAELYKILSESYEMTNNYNSALINHKLYKTYNDSLFNIQNTEKIAEIQTKYDLETAETENILLKKDIKIQALTIAKQRNLQLLLFVLLFLIISYIILVYLRMKKDRKVNVVLSAKNEEIKRKSEELEKANMAKDKFFSILAHDLRNPFNSILGSLEILQQNYEKLSDKERVHFINLIHKSTDATNELLANLLDWSLAQRGEIKLEKKNQNIFSIIQESVNIHHNLAVKKDIEIENLVEKNISAYVDRKTISITVNNLINNAIKFTKKNGKITISNEKSNGFTQIIVKDTGIGIPQNILNSLFKIEATMSRPGTNDEPGTGLGLILCKEFVEKNKGVIEVETEVGKGSSFKISVPTQN